MSLQRYDIEDAINGRIRRDAAKKTAKYDFATGMETISRSQKTRSMPMINITVNVRFCSKCQSYIWT